MNPPAPTVLLAGALQDASGVSTRAGAVVVDCGKVVFAGRREDLSAEFSSIEQRIDLPDSLVLPGFVNAHAHLELTDIGPKPYDAAGGFVGWIKMLRSKLPTEPQPNQPLDPAWFVQAAEQGITQSLAAGVQAIGDISRFSQVSQARRSSPLGGVTFIECFGLGVPFDQAGLDEIEGGCDGLQPHAPYTAGPALFAKAAASGRPLSTHLAETLDEAEFVGTLRGAKLAFMQSLGLWDAGFASGFGKGGSPVQWMRPHLERAARDGGWLLAHCNYVDDDDLATLADTASSVAYCPIASAYFEHPCEGHPPHRYRAMIAQGINVALGTDSIICQAAYGDGTSAAWHLAADAFSVCTRWC